MLKNEDHKVKSPSARAVLAAVILTVFAVSLCSCRAAEGDDSGGQNSGGTSAIDGSDCVYAPIVDPYKIYTYEQMRTDIGKMKNMYSKLVDVYSIGLSAEGRDIPAFNVGCGSRNIILFGSMHGNEYISTAFVMYMLDRYLLGYAADSTISGVSCREILDEYTFVVVPMVNPDGVNIAQNGPDAAKNPDEISAMTLRETSYAGWKANANGVDLNRNFPYYWQSSSTVTSPASAEYRGEYAGSEPETKALLAFIASVDFEAALSFHTFGEVLYWADNKSEYLTERYRPLAQYLADGIGYRLLDPENLDDFGGYMINYMRGTYGKFCMTVELCPQFYGFNYPESDFDSMAEKVLPIGLLLAQKLKEQ